jgi:hypothetical protein
MTNTTDALSTFEHDKFSQLKGAPSQELLSMLRRVVGGRPYLYLEVTQDISEVVSGNYVTRAVGVTASSWVSATSYTDADAGKRAELEGTCKAVPLVSVVDGVSAVGDTPAVTVEGPNVVLGDTEIGRHETTTAQVLATGDLAAAIAAMNDSWQ